MGRGGYWKANKKTNIQLFLKKKLNTKEGGIVATLTKLWQKEGKKLRNVYAHGWVYACAGFHPCKYMFTSLSQV